MKVHFSLWQFTFPDLNWCGLFSAEDKLPLPYQCKKQLPNANVWAGAG